MRPKFFLCTLALALGACTLPNPYSPPSRPATVPPQPAPGSMPSVPAPGDAAREPVRAPTPAPTAPPARTYTLSPASQALVSQARTQAATGDYTLASSTIERALRIEPDNPLLWTELSRVRLAEGNYTQAESLGRKAVSLATGDARAEATAWRMIAESLRARGRNAEAREADLRAAALTTR